jgi:uncharacterized protein (TIGR03437 family)
MSLFGRVRPVLPLGVLFAGLAFAQTITTSPTSLSISVEPGQTATRTLAVQSTTPITFNASATYGSGYWLTVYPNSNVSTPTDPPLIVSVDARYLTTGVYFGAIQIVQATNSANAISVSVSLTVGTPTSGNPTLAVSPTVLSFAAQAGGLVPFAQSLNVTSTIAGLTFAVSTATNDGFAWLHASTANATAPAVVTVSVNTAGMPGGNYTGNIVLTPATGAVVNIPVSLTLTSGTGIFANVSAFRFYYQIGTFLPTSQTFTLTASGNSAIPFNITPTTTDGYNWLTITPTNASTPQTVTVSVNPYQLPAGTFNGNIHVSAPTATNGTLDIPVTMLSNVNALLTVSSTPAAFTYQTGMSAPSPQTVAISATSGTLNYTVATSTSDGTNWLAVSPLSGTANQSAQNLTIAVNPSALATGNYTGNIIITAPGATNSPVAIPISLSVNNASTLTVNPQSITMNLQTGVVATQVLSQPLYVDSTSGSVQFSASAVPTTCGSTWLSVNPANATTPAVVNVVAQQGGLTAPLICNATVVLTQSGGLTPLQVPVALNVSTNRSFNVTPLSLNFSAPFGGDPTATKPVALSTTDGSVVSFTAAASVTSGTWLRLDHTSGTTPGTLNVAVDPANLSVATYSGQITISSPGLVSAVVIPITFKVTAVASAAASPGSFSFTQVVGGAAPANQSLALTSTNGVLSFAISTSTNDMGGWLTMNQYEGYTPANLAVKVSGGNLPAGTYHGTITVNVPGATNNPLSIPVTLTMTPTSTPAITVDHSSLTFSYQQGGTRPQSQQINVTTTGNALSVAAAVASGSNWLSVSPASATTPGAFSVSVSPGPLSIGGYDGSITLTPAGGTAVIVNVHLDVTPASVPVTGITSVSNAASSVRGPISPGEIVTIMGSGLGPATGTGLVLDNNKVSTTVAGTQVFFDTFAAPILYTSATQVNVIVPYEVTGRTTVQVTVVYQGTTSDNYTMQVAATVPGIFTATQNGRGQGAILNQDNTYNGAAAPSVPADRGSIVQVFATGEGVTYPPNATGAVTPDAGYPPVAAVTAIVGGVPAEVTFKGSAPGAVAGLFQVNVRIPQSVSSGDVSIVISVGGVQSQSGVTVAVK